MSAPSDPPQVHGDGLTPLVAGAGTSERQGAAEGDDEDYGDERHQLAMVIHDGGCQCRGHTLGWTIRSRDSLQLADAVLAAGYVRVQDDDETVERMAREMLGGPVYLSMTDSPLATRLVEAVGAAVFEEIKKYPTPPPFSGAIPGFSGATQQDVGRVAVVAALRELAGAEDHREVDEWGYFGDELAKLADSIEASGG